MCELETPFIHPLNTALTKRVILFVYWICGARHFQPLHPPPPSPPTPTDLKVNSQYYSTGCYYNFSSENFDIN